jgi:arsenate reductase
VHYLDTPPDADTIRMLISTFDGPSRDLVRRDRLLAEMSITLEQLDDTEAIVKVVLTNPELLQRPLLSDGSRTVIGRPTEHIAEMLDG